MEERKDFLPEPSPGIGLHVMALSRRRCPGGLAYHVLKRDTVPQPILPREPDPSRACAAVAGRAPAKAPRECAGQGQQPKSRRQT